MSLAMPSVFGELLTDIISAIVILLLGFVLGKILGATLYKLFLAIFPDKKLKGNHKNGNLARNISGAISLCVYVVAIILALERLKITLLVLKIILLVCLVIIVGALIFVILNFILNSYYGLNIMTSNKFRKGDLIKIKKVEGIVKRIDLVHTKIVNDKDEIFIIPNRLFFRNKFSKETKNK